MLATLLSLALGQAEFHYPEPIFPGFREWVLGPQEYPATVLGILYSKEFPSVETSRGMTMPSWEERAMGTAMWSVKPDVFGSTPCLTIKLEGDYRAEYRYRFKNSDQQVKRTVPVKGISTWWVSKDGTILRQYESRTDERGVRTANGVYAADRIEVTVDEFGKRRIATLYPGDMAKLQAQFRPMIVDGKVLLKEKEFLVFDPFTSGYVRHTVRLAGLFKADLIGAHFEGRNVDVDGYSDGVRRAYLSLEGDLVRVDLPNDRFMRISSLPPGKSHPLPAPARG